MSKPDRYPVPESNVGKQRRSGGDGGVQEPMSGSKKTKQNNHVSHRNPQG
ncbi:small acid-soluble spore protein P [Paenibacillus arenilitoris]|uniref:Small acid-soluble spore protein P n=1 Tax=Paenibacillus arenilitoris TaxID=2772299 RepID=A0A927CQF9_9BACL|nr:small acid-soluble spore protein P [Paenibacillus arenilitoris]MBD2871662.1 small acid-soluble spore protein P [Paenibacillus arenilitoris]